jgi:hypothetical protein
MAHQKVQTHGAAGQRRRNPRSALALGISLGLVATLFAACSGTSAPSSSTATEGAVKE